MLIDHGITLFKGVLFIKQYIKINLKL